MPSDQSFQKLSSGTRRFFVSCAMCFATVAPFGQRTNENLILLGPLNQHAVIAGRHGRFATLTISRSTCFSKYRGASAPSLPHTVTLPVPLGCSQIS